MKGQSDKLRRCVLDSRRRLDFAVVSWVDGAFEVGVLSVLCQIDIW